MTKGNYMAQFKWRIVEAIVDFHSKLIFFIGYTLCMGEGNKITKYCSSKSNPQYGWSQRVSL